MPQVLLGACMWALVGMGRGGPDRPPAAVQWRQLAVPPRQPEVAREGLAGVAPPALTVRFAGDRHGCEQIPLVVSLVMAALYFSTADLCFTGSFSSHTFSSKSLPAKNWSAILMWHLITAAVSLPSSLPTLSAHFS